MRDLRAEVFGPTVGAEKQTGERVAGFLTFVLGAQEGAKSLIETFLAHLPLVEHR